MVRNMRPKLIKIRRGGSTGYYATVDGPQLTIASGPPCWTSANTDVDIEVPARQFCHDNFIDFDKYTWQRVQGPDGVELEGTRHVTQAVLHRKQALWPIKITVSDSTDEGVTISCDDGAHRTCSEAVSYAAYAGNLYKAALAACEQLGIDYAMYDWSDYKKNGAEIVGEWTPVVLSEEEVANQRPITDTWLYSKELPDFRGLDNTTPLAKLRELCHRKLVVIRNDRGAEIDLDRALKVPITNGVGVPRDEIFRMCQDSCTLACRAGFYGMIAARTPPNTLHAIGITPGRFTTDDFTAWIITAIDIGVIAPDGIPHATRIRGDQPPLDLFLIADQTTREVACARWAAGNRLPSEIMRILDEDTFQTAKSAFLNQQVAQTSEGS